VKPATTRESLLATTYDQLTASSSHHRLLHRLESRWVSTYVIRRPDNNLMITEITVGLWDITFQGDSDLMSFRGGPSDHRSRLAWLANARGSYLTEKASLGTSCSGMIWDYDDDLAAKDILCERRLGNLTKEQASEAWSTLRCEDAQAATKAVYEMGEAESIDFGRVLRTAVVAAHVAAKRLVHLLESHERMGS
jgi:hypothetical protein